MLLEVQIVMIRSSVIRAITEIKQGHVHVVSPVNSWTVCNDSQLKTNYDKTDHPPVQLHQCSHIPASRERQRLLPTTETYRSYCMWLPLHSLYIRIVGYYNYTYKYGHGYPRYGYMYMYVWDNTCADSTYDVHIHNIMAIV